MTSRSARRIRISSHFPFHRVNVRLDFDREAARGFRLDVAAGAYVGWEPGETKSVRLVRYAGEGGADAGSADADAGSADADAGSADAAPGTEAGR